MGVVLGFLVRELADEGLGFSEVREESQHSWRRDGLEGRSGQRCRLEQGGHRGSKGTTPGAGVKRFWPSGALGCLMARR
jgi:hypothetical protein